MLAGFAPAIMPVIAIDKVQAAQTEKKKKKKTVQKKQNSGVKTNYGAPRPGEPNAGWTDDCLNYYNIYGRLPFYCDKNGRGFGRDR